MKFTSLFDPEVFEGSYWPTITYHYARTWTQFIEPPHWHPTVEIMYLFMGRCSVFVEERSAGQREIPMRSGDFVLLDANAVHRLYVEPGSFCYILNVEFAFDASPGAMFTLKNVCQTSDAFAQLTAHSRTAASGSDVSGELYRAMHMLQTSYLRVRAQQTTRCVFDAEMAVFLIQLAQALLPRHSRDGLSVHVRRAISHIENHFDTPLSVPSIAKHVGVHAGHLQRTFKAAMDMTIVQYITRVRIDKAMALLESAELLDLSVDDVARMVGFQSRQHFAQCFKRLEMISPSEYRQNHHRTERIQYTLDVVPVPRNAIDDPDLPNAEQSDGTNLNLPSAAR